MERDRIEPSNERLLLNAEPFGFGPSVAVASIFPYLRKRFKQIGFVGEGHTLDVQKKLPYNATYDISQLTPEAKEKRLREIAANYDVFFTAMDFPLAKRMHEFGMRKICRYDALTWYWPQLPEPLGDHDLYLAQDFLGVKEKLRKEPNRFARTEVVPPLVPSKQPKRKGEHVLVNLGGLQNPLWSVDETTIYARKIYSTILFKIIPPNEKVIIATSKAIAERIGSPRLIYTREEMKEVLTRAKYAFMTPGLGNIYDSAIYDIPTVWLPPANDSQGQQLELLRQNNMIDGAVDWKDIGTAIDYDSNQKGILEQISHAVHQATMDVLAPRLVEEHEKLQGRNTSATTLLLDQFGTNGEERVAELVYKFAQGITKSTHTLTL